MVKETIKREYEVLIEKWELIAYDENGNEKIIDEKNRSLFKIGNSFMKDIMNDRQFSDVFLSQNLIDSQIAHHLNMMKKAIDSEMDREQTKIADYEEGE